MPGERLLERAAALDIGLDIEHEPLHCRLVMPVADNFEGLHHRDARGHHRRELAAEHRNVDSGYLAAAAERLRLRSDLGRSHSLTPQIGTHGCFVDRDGLAAHLVAAFILALPGKWDFLFACGCRYSHNSILSVIV